MRIDRMVERALRRFVRLSLLTNPVRGIGNYKEMMRLLVEDKDALKVYVDVAEG